jgi:hypothetical protein
MTDFDDLDERDRALAQKLRTQLRASEDLDYVTKARLSAARARALAASRRPAGWWFATGGLTAAVLLAVVMVVRIPQAAAPTMADALEMMTDELEPEFYQDLDMYQWLADSGTDPGADSA